MATDSPILNLQELIDGNHYGTHRVQNPITVYKKIRCKERMNFVDLFFKYVLFRQFSEKPEFDAIAELEIPKDAIIVRSLTYGYDSNVSPKLRTDRAIVKKIKANRSNDVSQYDMGNCECYSIFSNKYKYHVGKEQKPEKDFNNNVFKECTSGIHFFLEKYDANKY